MNKLVVEINDDYHLNILNVELIRSKNRTFQEDFYQFRSRLQYGLDSIDHGDRLKIIVDVDSRIEIFIEELAVKPRLKMPRLKMPTMTTTKTMTPRPSTTRV